MHSVSPNARLAVQQLRASKIREVANAGIGRSDLAAFWFGEPDEVTPAFIRQAATDALAAGETFYTHNLGIPELREAIAAYISRLHRPTTIDNIAVTNSGMSALMIASQAIVGPGDHVVAVTPLWPNLVEIPKILGAQVTTVALQFTSAGWQLDVERLLDALRCADRRLVEIGIARAVRKRRMLHLSGMAHGELHLRRTGTPIAARLIGIVIRGHTVFEPSGQHAYTGAHALISRRVLRPGRRDCERHQTHERKHSTVARWQHRDPPYGACEGTAF
jgi:hypothetical protein